MQTAQISPPYHPFSKQTWVFQIARVNGFPSILHTPLPPQRTLRGHNPGNNGINPEIRSVLADLLCPREICGARVTWGEMDD